MENTKPSGLKRGAWSGEEDLLLRRSIETHGPGKWHLVPVRAGLNRCRKSCRLRWMNYLQPNLNKEEFKEDEIDLLIKLHKLLGNRWSLIAGRLPGRTPNDVKNYWNTHLRKRINSKPDEKKHEKNELIRPKPTYFKSKVPPTGVTNYNKGKTQQEKGQTQHCMLQPTEGQNMWLNELLLEDDRDPTMAESAKAMDSNGDEFDGSPLEWNCLLDIDNWVT